jgi:hypothetical protein
MSTIVSFLDAKSLFFFLICIISIAFSINFLSLLLNELTGMYFSSIIVSNLSNLFRGFRHDDVVFLQILCSVFLDYYYSHSYFGILVVQ